jgi:hypothetical protein
MPAIRRTPHLGRCAESPAAWRRAARRCLYVASRRHHAGRAMVRYARACFGECERAKEMAHV